MLLYTCFCLLFSHISGFDDHYSIIVDAGSTGSRAFIFHFFKNENGTKVVESKKGRRVEPGISSIHINDLDILEYLLPVFTDAQSYIPVERHNSTEVYIKGTAGMRLLPVEDQTKIWRIVNNGLITSPHFPFHLKSDALGTIDGQSEAYYAVLSSNYIEGSIDADLVPQSHVPMVGAFDMGGSSTQLIFYTGKQLKTESISREDFWSNSWLNYGVEKMREQVLEALIADFYANNLPSPSDETGGGRPPEGVMHVIPNPCTFAGFEHVWNASVVLRGTGDSMLCVQLIKRFLWPDYNEVTSEPLVVAFEDSGDSDEHSCIDSSCKNSNSNGTTITARHVAGVKHPPLEGHFYGMSVYFYALDCIRHLGPADIPDWPSPSIDDLEAAAHAFCSQNWTRVQEALASAGHHPYTREAQLAHRCAESLYVVTLLEHAFGLPGHHRNLTLALDVKGMEVEWTLGFALAEVVPTLHWTDNSRGSSGGLQSLSHRNLFMGLWSSFCRLVLSVPLLRSFLRIIFRVRR